MKIIRTDHLTDNHKMDIIDLWNAEYPKAIALENIQAFEAYLDTLSDVHHLLLTQRSGKVMGWLVYFIRDSERFFAMLLNPGLQGKGYGSILLTLAKCYNSELNGWVIDNDNQPKQNGQNYISPIGFYKKNGFEILPEIKFKKNNFSGIKVRWQK